MKRSTTALALLCFCLVCPARAEEDALPIIEQAFEAAEANLALARLYVFHERVEERRFNKRGEEKKRESKTYDVTLLESGEYRRLIAINDRPLYPATAAKEQKRFEKHVKKVLNETPKQREKRLARIERGHQEGVEFLAQITKAFDFRLIGEDEIAGVATHVITAEPKDGYQPISRETKVLTRVRAKLWISRDDHAWVKAEIETLDNITWALIFKLRQGATIRFQQRRFNDEVWLMEHWSVRLRARLAFVYKLNGEFTGTYSNFRRFTTDATAVHTDAAR